MSKTSPLKLDLLWQSGLFGLSYLRDDQLDIYEHFEEHSNPVIECARRFGKTTSMIAYVEDQLRQNPGWVCRWCSPLKEQSRTIVRPELEKFERSCPKELKATWHAVGSFYEFPNQSKLYLIGINRGQAESARGPFANIVICDEFGFWDDASVVETILQPQLLTTRGKLITASTPPPDLGHSYYSKVSSAIAENRFLQRTIFDNESLSDDDINKAIEDSGGVDSPTFQREYLCKPVANPESLVVPEFKEELHVSEDRHSAVSNYYVALDLGFSDQTAVLFAAHDFPNDILYVLDEVVLSGANSRTIVEACKQKEQTHFQRPPWRRVSDNDLQQIYDFQTLYDYSVMPTQKWDKQSAINQLRLRFSAKKIKIHPRCKSLAFQLKVGIWNPRRTEFLRGEATGHLDAIDALIYLNRNIDQSHNPITEHFDWSSSFQSPHYVSESDKGIRELGDFFLQPSRDEP